jgi:hypothetical protein
VEPDQRGVERPCSASSRAPPDSKKRCWG